MSKDSVIVTNLRGCSKGEASGSEYGDPIMNFPGGIVEKSKGKKYLLNE
jgi:hypothetical protein